MLGLPDSAKFGKSVKKELFFTNLDMPSSIRAKYNKRITSIVWQYKLSPQTLNITKGQFVSEIEVMEVKIRDVKGFDYQVLKFIDTKMPHYLLFSITCGDWSQLFLDYKEPTGQENKPFLIKTTLTTPWLEKNEYHISLFGNDMDAVYANIVQMMAGGKLPKRDTLSSSVRDYVLIMQLKQQIERLQKKKGQEVQVNKIFELRHAIWDLQEQVRKLEEL
jgi:hypothetical protein